MNKKLLSGLFLLLMLLSIWRLLFHVQVQTDITGFMPKAQTESQSLLLHQLENGAAARLWILVLSKASVKELATASKTIAQQAAASPLVAQVWNGQQGLSSPLQTLLFDYRYLLSDRITTDSYSVQGLRGMFERLLLLLRSPLSTFSKSMASRDPGAESIHILEALQGQGQQLQLREGVWFSKASKQAVLLLQSSMSGTDLDAQQQLYDQLQDGFRQYKSTTTSDAMQLDLGGVPVISLQTRAQIRDTSQKLSVAATAFMLLFMLVVYRNPRKVLLTALPLLSGVLVGVSLVSWWFGSIHGITLAFGVILLGVAVDYPVHVFSHQQAGERLSQTVKRIRSTLILGVLSSVLGFSAMLWTDFTGLSQLGLFAVSGLLMAAWVSISILPLWVGTDQQPLRWSWELPTPRMGILGIVALVSGIVLTSALVIENRDIWSKDIQALSPVPEQSKRLDQQLRVLVGAADPGMVLLVMADSEQELLEKQEQILPQVQQAVKMGYLQGADFASAILPSIKRQQLRQSWIPPRPQLEQYLMQALQGLPFKPQSFQAFVADLQHSRELPPLSPADLGGSPLKMRLQNLMLPLDEGFVGVVPLRGVAQPSLLRAWLEADDRKDLWLLNIPEATSELVDDFRQAIVSKLLLALTLIGLLVLIWLRDLGRWIGVMLPVVLSMMVAVIAVLLSGVGLNLFHLVSLLLVAGIGLDYALFFSRPADDEQDWRHTQQALLVCVLSTVVVFVMLAFSAIPVLRAIGMTVAVGITSAFLLSWLIAGRKIAAGNKNMDIR